VWSLAAKPSAPTLGVSLPVAIGSIPREHGAPLHMTAIHKQPILKFELAPVAPIYGRGLHLDLP
jgi:hypothetical protein